MKSSKQKVRSSRGISQVCGSLDQTISSPEFQVLPKLWGNKKDRSSGHNAEKTPRDGCSASESNLPSKRDEQVHLEEKAGQGDDKSSDSSLTMREPSSPEKENMTRENEKARQRLQGLWRNDRAGKSVASKKSRSCSPSVVDLDDPLTRQIRDIHNNTRKSARIIRDSRARLLQIQKKSTLTEAEVKELGERNELLLREMERFDRLTRNIQKLVGAEVVQMRKTKEENMPDEIPMRAYEPAVYHEMKMNHPTVVLGSANPFGIEKQTRSKSEIDLTRKLSESYDMQEKLVADNADLEVKRYILYKELMTKDQHLENCRAQIKSLQGELKLLYNENTSLQEKLTKNNPQGDATAMSQDNQPQKLDDCTKDEEIVCVKNPQELISQLQYYKTYTADIDKEVGVLEYEVRNLRAEMDSVKAGSACRGGGANTCFEQAPGGPPVPPMTRACGVCPPCPAPCNPNHPPTPAEKEVQKLTIQLRQTEENFKTKVTECAMLRAELLKKKEELEKERCQHREVQNRLRELEMKFEGLTTQTNMMMGTKEQAFEQEVNVRALKQCYREAREEIDELRLLMKEQNDQLQDYRVKYLQAQQLVEEQRRQMDMMDMDNSRISEQINLEIQKVKLKFQEKLQELAPIPDLLKATQMKLKDAQQSQAIAEHNAEQLARELNSAREKVHVLLHNSLKPPEKPPERGGDEKQMALLQQRIAQLTENNMTLKSEIERLKSNVIRMEECVLANEKRLQEKMHECAQLGGELDRARDEAARALQRANERTDTIRKCMQTTVAELERQLASTRAQVKNAEKDREEVQSRMQCQIKRLNENFEQAQLRILGLQTQVQTLRRTASSTGDGDGEGDGEQQECACRAFFENP
ncbi:paramyosin-like [Colias croceus]|uniref:paramyosin-like n=1 Tax=Colias crocea TaxID=72248 RepID=UPI001E27D0B3|nr:paramyosin-like [Colias croceus]XP_045509912.1 paramyosin-like [Colias croceus]XP_045509913.1 paramyosin-like [Colias croceus]